jgi:hypothetical protein
MRKAVNAQIKQEIVDMHECRKNKNAFVSEKRATIVHQFRNYSTERTRLKQSV